MEKGKIKDLLSASKETFIQELLESDEVPEVIKNVAELFVSEGTAAIFGTAFGAIAPRLNSVRLSYKALRFERNVENAVALMAERVDDIETNFAQLNEYMQDKFCGPYVGWMFDSLYDERQEEKVSYYINGYINLMSNEANDNLVLLFFDTISQLTQLDIEVLALYQINAVDNVITLCKRNGLQYNQLNMIREKLTRLGLLNSKNDEIRDNNIDLIVEYLKDVDKATQRNNSKKVKLPRIKNPRRSESYRISALGRQYLQIISDKE